MLEECVRQEEECVRQEEECVRQEEAEQARNEEIGCDE